MYLILISWIYIAVTSFTWGFTTNYILKKEKFLNLPLLIVLGLAVQCFFLMYLSIFIKISLIAHILVLGISLISILWLFKSIKAYFIHGIKDINPFYLVLVILIFLGFVLILLHRSHDVTSHYDTGLYHHTYIKWIQNYPVIYGLGNIHERLAFNSSWHVLCAFYDFAFIQDLNLNDLNAFLYLVIFLFSVSGILNLLRGQNQLNNILKAILLLPTLWTSTDFFSLQNKIYFDSPSTDLPVVLLVWLVFILFLEYLEGKKYNSYIIIIISVFAITVKLSVLPILLLPLYIFIQNLYQMQLKTASYLAFFGIVGVLPWILRSIYLSGYLVFPLYQIDLFTFDWKVKLETTERTAQLISSWAKGMGTDNTKGIADWLPVWYDNLTFQNVLLLHYIIIFTLLYFIFFIILFSIKNSKSLLNINNFGIIYAILTCLIGILFWFFSAPDVRFGYAFTLFYIILGMALLFKYFLDDYLKYFAIVIILINLHYVYSISNSIKKRVYIEAFSPTIKYPQIKVKSFQTHTKNIEFYVPESGESCWGSPLPCLHPTKNNKAQLRGETIREGFRAK